MVTFLVYEKLFGFDQLGLQAVCDNRYMSDRDGHDARLDNRAVCVAQDCAFRYEAPPEELPASVEASAAAAAVLLVTHARWQLRASHPDQVLVLIAACEHKC